MSFFRTFIIIYVTYFLLACSSQESSSQQESNAHQESSSQIASADDQFESLLQKHWSSVLKNAPTFATSLGVREYDDRLRDPSLQAYESEIEETKELLNEFEALELSALSKDNQLNHALMTMQLKTDIEASAFGGKYMIMTNRGGPHMTLAGLPDRLPFFTKADYASYVTRLSLMPEYLEKSTERLAAGLADGWVQPCAPMQGFEKSITAHIVSKVEDSVFLDPFDKKPAAMDQGAFDELRADATDIVESKIIPAYKKFEEFYTAQYFPACRNEVGTSSLPNGVEYYQHRVRLFTTTDRTAEQVHNLGLSEVARIRDEMDKVQEQAGFNGSFKEFQDFLRTNKDFYPKTAQDRMDAVAVIMKKMDGLLPELFTKFPRMPYGIKEIPLDIAEKTTTAYYQRPAGDGSRAGFYFVNTTNLDKRPLYELEALSLHEAVPGHHFQLALAQELPLPNFRKYGGFTAFVEGWGLYSERLGLDVGFYQTPYTNFGRLSYEMWRACRLVVDTGMHAKGWSRQQAIDYMVANTGLSLKNITTEVDRYITWPGQALAYKIGELKIRELRAFAETELGENFDIRLFHDAVLANGAVPMSVLEEQLKAWVADIKSGS